MMAIIYKNSIGVLGIGGSISLLAPYIVTAMHKDHIADSGVEDSYPQFVFPFRNNSLAAAFSVSIKK